MSDRLQPLCDKIGRNKIDIVVHEFYDKLRAHPELQPFFAHIADFTRHERHIADFWWLAMGGRLEARPQFDMVRRHAPLQLHDAALQQWLAVFNETLTQHLSPELAAQWYQMAQGIGANLARMLFTPARAGVIPILPTSRS